VKKKSEENSGSSRRISTEGSTGRKKFSGDFEPPTKSDRAPRRDSTGSSDRPARTSRPSFGDRADRPSRPSFGDRPDRPARPSFGDRPARPARPSFGDRSDRPARPSFGDRSDRPARSSYGDRSDRPARSSYGDRSDRPARPSRSSYGDRPDRPSRSSYGDRPARPSFGDRSGRPARPTRAAGGDRTDRPAPKSQRIDRLKKNLEDMDRTSGLDLAAEWNDLQLQNLSQEFSPESDSETIPKARPRTKPKASKSSDALAWPMRVNRYVSLSGLCSRRTADELISAGRITINEQVADVLGTKVNADDVVRYDGEVLTLRRYVYVLLNKPKDYITTMDDPENRRTVMELVEDATIERIVPAGRLDRNTTGLLLLTNDGDLIQKLTHPSSEIAKIYAVELDKPLSQKDFSQILEGVPLEDGLARVDALAWPEPRDKKLVGLSLHSGKNRIVRRIFEQLGYEVQRLDRVSYAGLTKKDLPRGHWRYLSEKEVRFLKAGKKVF
jgi:23S rRNA pseudouridine2605 synthase